MQMYPILFSFTKWREVVTKEKYKTSECQYHVQFPIDALSSDPTNSGTKKHFVQVAFVHCLKNHLCAVQLIVSITIKFYSIVYIRPALQVMSAVNFKNLRNMMVDESLNCPGSQRFNSNVRTFARHATIRERDFSENN